MDRTNQNFTYIDWMMLSSEYYSYIPENNCKIWWLSCDVFANFDVKSSLTKCPVVESHARSSHVREGQIQMYVRVVLLPQPLLLVLDTPKLWAAKKCAEVNHTCCSTVSTSLKLLGFRAHQAGYKTRNSWQEYCRHCHTCSLVTIILVYNYWACAKYTTIHAVRGHTCYSCS